MMRCHRGARDSRLDGCLCKLEKGGRSQDLERIVGQADQALASHELENAIYVLWRQAVASAISRCVRKQGTAGSGCQSSAMHQSATWRCVIATMQRATLQNAVPDATVAL